MRCLAADIQRCRYGQSVNHTSSHSSYSSWVSSSTTPTLTTTTQFPHSSCRFLRGVSIRGTRVGVFTCSDSSHLCVHKPPIEKELLPRRRNNALRQLTRSLIRQPSRRLGWAIPGGRPSTPANMTSAWWRKGLRSAVPLFTGA
jgi:hypothetical protein